ncbi:MAG: 23S rRNA (guanosine(2251)-2'-O)-methyltransferase RlmB, partial [Eubacterium sp.]|nr:23S rRNA (guanosine(2251)-2'-O)-methyltransferase RlmB [Eubacterium sp.]
MITSPDNPRIRQVIRLNRKAKERRLRKCFAAEGKKLFLETPQELR